VLMMVIRVNCKLVNSEVKTLSLLGSYYCRTLDWYVVGSVETLTPVFLIPSVPKSGKSHFSSRWSLFDFNDRLQPGSAQARPKPFSHTHLF
jgi:hypothetical protein